MTPYLSIVMGVGGDLTDDLLGRLEASLEMTCFLAKQFSLRCEVVIVEWATEPPDYMNLIALPRTEVPIRAIHAGHLHSTVPNPHGFRYFEWYPKNIGIRRAHGEFVLSTNPDDLFGEDMMEFLARQELQHGHFYRANRHDMQNGKVYRICYPTGCKPPDASLEEIQRPEPHACPYEPGMLHYNASGDFTLMAKDDWFLIHGNPERDYNHSVDGQTLWLAHTKGLQQAVLPYPIFHPDHVRTLNHAYAPEWKDWEPHTKENGDGWGFAGIEFEETEL